MVVHCIAKNVYTSIRWEILNANNANLHFYYSITLVFISIPTQEVLCFGLWIRIFYSRAPLRVKAAESETGLTNARNSTKDSETKLIPSL